MRRLVALLALLALIAAACGDSDDDASSASDASSENAPAETTADVPAEPVWENVAGGEDCGCADGSDYSFWVREADPTEVVFYFQGGGSCFSAESCSFTDGDYKVTTGPEDDPTSAGGIFDMTNPANPFADRSWVFVSYCTGDSHLGDRVTDYGSDVVVDHNGFANGERALEELVTRFGGAEEVFVTGSSAGGIPAPLFAGLVADELPDARVVALADGSGAFSDVPAINEAVGALWGTFDNVPDWSVNDGLTPADWSIPGLFTQASLHQPDIVMARHDHAFDEAQVSVAAAAGMLSSDLLTLIDDNAEGIEAEGVEVSTYVAPGTEHTILGQDFVYTQEVAGVAFIDWLTALAEGEAVEDVHCEVCE